MDPRQLAEHEVKFITGAFKAAPNLQRTFRFKISDATIDHDNDVVDPAGWDLSGFKRSGGPVMFGHDYKSLPVAKDVGIVLEQDGLYGYPQFPVPGIHPFADTVHDLIAGGFLNAASVGFKPTKYLYNDERKGYDISQAVLLEYSIVPIGANPAALVQRAKAAGIDLKPIESWCEQYLDETYGAKGIWVPRFQVEETFKFINDHKATIAVKAEPNTMKPTPKPDEDEDEYVGRCMADPAMVGEFPDEAQRAAVCHSKFGKAAKQAACPACGAHGAPTLELEDAPTLELAEEIVYIEPQQVEEAVASAVRAGLTEVITHQVRARVDYARGRVI